MKMSSVITVFLTATFFAPLLMAQAPWWDPAWPYRKEITINDAKGKNVAALEMSHGGKILKDGADIRVVGSAGTPVKSSILRVCTDDRVRVLFECDAPKKPYYLYYGNKDAKPLAEWSPNQGLILETRKAVIKGVNPDNWQAMKKIIDQSPEVQDRQWRPKIWDGVNPFGPSLSFLSLYTGYLECPVQGDYTFFTVSDDASFVFIQGKPVTEWPGWHGGVEGQYGKYSGTVTLSPGVVKVEYYHLQGDGGTAALLGWKKPGDKDPGVIPDTAFTPFMLATVKESAQSGETVFPDFEWRKINSYRLENTWLCHYAFRGLERGGQGATYTWNFGDGYLSHDKDPMHVYGETGLLQVSLTLKEKGGKETTFTQKVWVEPCWDQMDENPQPMIRNVSKQIHAKDYTDASPLTQWALTQMFCYTDRREEAEEAATNMLAALQKKSSPETEAFLVPAGDLLLKWVRGHKAAAACYQEALRRGTKEANDRVRMGLVDLLLNDLGETADVGGLIEKLKKEAKIPQKEQAQLFMFEADLILDGARELNAEGKKERAAQAKNLIDKAAERAGKPDAFLEARRNAVLVTVENYIKTKEFEGALQAVDLFEKDVPASRYDPYFSSLRARAYLGFKETTAALLAIDRALILDPTSNYAPTLLDLKATIFETTLNKPGEAVKILQQILTDYPAYDKRTEIQERLKKLGK